MTDEEITEKLERLNRVAILGRPVAMGLALYEACTSRGLISMDAVAQQGVQPRYLGLYEVVRPRDLPDWEFQIGPPHA